VGSFLIASGALKTPTTNGYNAQGVNLKERGSTRVASPLVAANRRSDSSYWGVGRRYGVGVLVKGLGVRGVRCRPYVLNTRSDATCTIVYSDSAYFLIHSP